MKRILLSLVAMLSLGMATSCKEIVFTNLRAGSSAQLETQDANQTYELTNVGSFDAIEAHQAIDVRYNPTGPKSVKITTNVKDRSLIDIHVVGETLQVGYADGINSINGSVVTIVEVSGYAVYDFEASSSASITTTQPLVSTLDYELSANSAGSIQMTAIEGKSLDFDASSSGTIRLGKAKVEQLSVDASSAGEIEVKEIAASNVSVEASSSGTVQLSGTTSHAKYEVSSGASIQAGGLKSETAKAEASSGGSITCKAASLRESTSSGGSVSNKK